MSGSPIIAKIEALEIKVSFGEMRSGCGGVGSIHAFVNRGVGAFYGTIKSCVLTVDFEGILAVR